MISEEMLEKNLRIMEAVEKIDSRRKGESTYCLSIFLGGTSVWVLLVQLWEMLGRPIAPESLTYGVEIIAVIMFFVTQLKTHLKPKDLGLNFKDIRSTMIRAVCISAVIIALFIGLKLILRPGQPLFNLSRFSFRYLFTSIIQEFLARGFLLTCMLNIYDHSMKKHISVILSSLLFTTLHLYYGFVFMVGAGILSLILGYMYLKDENIWGVSLVHFVFGSTTAILAIT